MVVYNIIIKFTQIKYSSVHIIILHGLNIFQYLLQTLTDFSFKVHVDMKLTLVTILSDNIEKG